MVAIVAIGLAAQLLAPAGEVGRGDLEFIRGVEEFVIAASPGRRPPEPYRGLIERLGDPSWRGRESASRELEATPAADRRWLYWGRLHPDPEVRLRSNALLRRLHPCPTCKGAGNSKNWELWPCSDCEGTATAWPWSMWD
jgi:hypothetical protein